MRKSLGISVVALFVALPLIADDGNPFSRNDQFSPKDPIPSPPVDEARPSREPGSSAPTNSGTVRRTVVRYEPYTVVDPKTGVQKTEFRQVSHLVQEKVPTDPAEIESLRKRLRELHERRIESLTPAELATEVSQGDAEAKEREAWGKLQEARELLEKIATEFPSTRAARVAAQNVIPATQRPVEPEPTPPASLNPPLNPLPTY